MIEVSKLLLLALGELLLLSLVYVGVVNFLALSRRRRERAAIKTLVARIKEDSGRREAETRKIMEERFGLTENNLEETVRKIARHEKAFYQTLIDVFIKRDTEAVQNLCVDYEGSVDVYRSIELPAKADTQKGVTAADVADDDHMEELILLKAENQRLTEELQVTMDTMGNMLSEYTLMFAPDVDASLDREKMREVIVPDENTGEGPAGADNEAESTDDFEDLELHREITQDSTATDAEQAADNDTDLKALDEELGMLDLSEELPAADLDETVVLSADQYANHDDKDEQMIDLDDDEVVNLDDVLDDPGLKGS